MKKNLVSFGYERDQIKTGIVHIGVGNFHRAHLEYYTNKLLEDSSQKEWGICGLNLLPGDERIVKGLEKQDNLYTLTVCGRKGVDESYQIGSLIELIWAVEDPEMGLKKLADPNVKIITCTITEGGYNVDRSTGEFILDNKDVQFDLANPATPKTVFGYVAEGLRRRMKNGAGPVTFLTCDNLQHNGDTAKRVFTSFMKAQDKKLEAWVEENVTFPNSMVDRITPATTPDDVKRLNKKNGTQDDVPVYCEDFIQWVIEDNFIAGRPAWEKVGVEFTNDVTAFENMKLSLLNASHTLLSYPSFLSGYRKVDEAMHDKRFAKLLRDFMDIDITPYVPAPANTDLELYKQTLIERFGNRSVSDQISRLCADGASKYPVYVMPNLISMIRDKADMKRVAFSIASYRHYLKYRIDDKGVSFDINDPWLTGEDLQLIESNDPIDFLGISPFHSTDLKKADAFVKVYLEMVRDLKEKGVLTLLESII
ncbi:MULTISPECIES: mannitol dehydrogenase family protein [unclassified Proteiniphilum]|uniref:mannitol dehydrogenase family protein n=1 Tax=unclassified Proteiniphilum TaxID=2622718 RepID=UPI00257BFA16|nr:MULTISPECIES: mannitol dehydrogenase family protein [unclassified Proteiniphilum]